MSYLPRNIAWASVLAVVSCCCHAVAQQALVATTAQSAAGEPVRACVQRVDLSTGAILPDEVFLPGVATSGAMQATEDSQAALLLTGPVVRGDYAGPEIWFYSTTLRTTPLAASRTLAFSGGWRPMASCVAHGRNGEVLAVAGYQAGESGAWQGKLFAFPTDGDPYTTAEAAAVFQLPLRGAPAAMTALPPGDRVAVLYRGPYESAVGLAVVDMVRGEVLAEVESLADDTNQMSTAPGSISLSRDGAVLFVLISGYALDQRSGETVSWLYALDSATLARRGPPLELPGSAGGDGDCLQPAGPDSCWVATRPRGSNFAYATRIRFTGGMLVEEAQIPYSGIADAFSIAAEPDGASAAVAGDACVQVYDQHGAAVAEWSFKSPVRMLRWTAGGVLAGEAGRLHLLHPEKPDAIVTAPMQTGHVTDALMLPDGLLPSGAAAPDVRLPLPQSISFRGEAVGQEIKALAVRPTHAGASWSIEHDRAAMPWLVLHPVAGVGPGVVYMGIDPAWYRPGTLEEGTLTVRVAANRREPQSEIAGTRVEVRLLPEERSEIRRILWIWEDGDSQSLRDDDDPRRLRMLAEMLAGPPQCLVHRELVGTVQEPLDPYAVVVLGAAAAARGLVPRQAVIEYVLSGGAVLFLGRHLAAGGERDLTQWLAPVGAHIDAGVLVEGVFPAADPSGLNRHWPQVMITGGCGIYTDTPGVVQVPGKTNGDRASSVFWARGFGRGRIAVLASPSPLESAAMDSQGGRLFAADLFQWLAGADKYLDYQDMDSDGLPDDVEDANGNGIADPGETDFLNPDSDRDGIPDGTEDVNLNGIPDEGETDPLNADSDGDGVQDGADETPAPPAGALVLLSLNPAEGPAEGGTSVLITGRNLPTDAAAWFGERPSPRVRVLDSTELIAESPPWPKSDPGEAPVRVEGRSGEARGLMSRGFMYKPRSTVRLVLATLNQIRRQDALYEGTIELRLEKKPGVEVENVTLVLTSSAPSNVQWPQEAAAPRRRGDPVMRVLKSGDLLVAVLHAEPRAIPSRLMTLRWSCEAAEGSLPEIQIKSVQVYAPNGQTLGVEKSNLSVQADWMAQNTAPGTSGE